MTPDAADRRAAEGDAARPRRRRLPDGPQGVAHRPQEPEAEVPRRQRRRVGAGRVQGPRGDGARTAPADRGLPDRGARDRVRRSVFIYIRGEYLAEYEILAAAVERGARGRDLRRRPRSPSTAAPAPTSAARRPRCSSRSRASAASRGRGRRSRRSRASTRRRRRSTTSARSRPSRSILELGAEEFAKTGVPSSPGTAIFSVSGNVVRPGNYELAPRDADARADLRARRRHRRRPRAEGGHPRRLVGARAHARTRSTCRSTTTRSARSGRSSARPR